MPQHPKHWGSLLDKVLSGPPVPKRSSYTAISRCTLVLSPIHHLLHWKQDKKTLLGRLRKHDKAHQPFLLGICQSSMVLYRNRKEFMVLKIYDTWDDCNKPPSVNERSCHTCKPDFDQVQRMKHKRGDHTSTQSRDQVSYLDVTEDLLDMCGHWHSRHGFAGQPRVCHVNGTVIRSGAHVDRSSAPVS